jgi:hypothetical protein
MPSSPFSIDRFAPADATFKLTKHGDHVFTVDGDPDVDVVARMFRIEESLQSSAPEGDTSLGDAAIEGRQLLLELIQEKDPDFAGPLKVGLSELLVIFSLILRGTSVADAVADAILRLNPASGTTDDSRVFEQELDGDEPGREDGDGGPLASASGSPARSSVSATVADGLPAIGTA